MRFANAARRPICPMPKNGATKRSKTSTAISLKLRVPVGGVGTGKKYRIDMTNLENQIREAMQQSRRSCEDAHRAKQLAEQRLRLVHEEYGAAVATEKAAYANLKDIQEKSGGIQTSKALDTLKMEVNHLENDVAFQHQGLLQNQGKLEAEKKSNEQNKAYHASRIAELEAFLHQSRRKKNDLPRNRIATSSPIQMLQLHKDHVQAMHWRTIYGKKSQSLRHAMAEEKMAISSLERIIAGYGKHFPVEEGSSSVN